MQRVRNVLYCVLSRRLACTLIDSNVVDDVPSTVRSVVWARSPRSRLVRELSAPMHIFPLRVLALVLLSVFTFLRVFVHLLWDIQSMGAHLRRAYSCPVLFPPRLSTLILQ